jgi:hypothetical protein
MRALIAMIAAAVLALSLAACEPRTDDPHRRIYCQVVPDSPTRDNGDAPRRVVGQVRFWCDKPGADRLSVTLRLQRQKSNGAWVDVAKSVFTVRRGQTVRTDTQSYRTRVVSARCTSGTFRTVITGSSLARGVRETYRMTAAAAVDPCRPALF